MTESFVTCYATLAGWVHLAYCSPSTSCLHVSKWLSRDTRPFFPLIPCFQMQHWPQGEAKDTWTSSLQPPLQMSEQAHGVQNQMNTVCKLTEDQRKMRT